MNTTRTALYRHFDKNGELLYVGISKDPFNRFEQHRHSSSWIADVANMTVEWMTNSRFEALAVEREIIRKEKPRHNIMHNDGCYRSDKGKKSKAERIWIVHGVQYESVEQAAEILGLTKNKVKVMCIGYESGTYCILPLDDCGIIWKHPEYQPKVHRPVTSTCWFSRDKSGNVSVVQAAHDFIASGKQRVSRTILELTPDTSALPHTQPNHRTER